MKTKTITTGLNGPLSIALDGQGNLWVANFSGNNVTEYTSGKQDTVLTNGVSSPTSIAVDPMGDIWLVNGAANVTVLDSRRSPILNVPASKILPGASVVYNVAFSATGLCAFGTNTAHSESQGADFLALGDAAALGAKSGDGGRAMAFGGMDAYLVDGDGTVEGFHGAVLCCLWHGSRYRP